MILLKVYSLELMRTKQIQRLKYLFSDNYITTQWYHTPKGGGLK